MRINFEQTTTFIRKISLSKRLILYISIIFALQMVLIGYFSNSWISEYLKNMNIKKIREANYTIMHQVNFIRSKYEDISDNFVANPTIQDLLLTNLSSPSQTMILQNKRIIDQTLSDSNEKIYTIIAGENGIIYRSYSGKYNQISFEQIKNSEIHKQSMSSNGSNLWIPSNDNLFEGYSGPCLYLCRTYLSIAFLYERLGQLIIEIPVSELQQVFKESNLYNKEYYAIVNNDGKYIYHTQDINLIGTYTEAELTTYLSSGEDGYQIVDSGEEDILLSYSIYSGSGWSVIHVLPMNVIRSSARDASNIVILIMLFSLIIFAPVLVLIIKSFTNPIKTLKIAVEQFGNGDSDIRAKTDRLDEIGLLQHSFNKMADKINDQLKKIEEDNKQKRLMEINMLEYQINPHFLYNSLDFINWQAHKSGNDDISEMVTALAKFFRVGLSKGREYYMVKDELDHARQYLLINKLRFKDCFEFEIQADPEALKYSTIKIILQPAIENAIKHGINKYRTDGHIRVSAIKESKVILFTISDNGTGIAKDRLEIIQKIMANHTQADMDSENGFGLYNVNMRIWMQFGDGYGVTLESTEGNGTTVIIKIPAVTEY